MFMHKGLKSSDNSCRMKQKIAYNSTEREKKSRAAHFFWDSNSIKIMYTHASTAMYPVSPAHTHTLGKYITIEHHLQYQIDCTVTTCAKLRQCKKKKGTSKKKKISTKLLPCQLLNLPCTHLVHNKGLSPPGMLYWLYYMCKIKTNVKKKKDIKKILI